MRHFGDITKINGAKIEIRGADRKRGREGEFVRPRYIMQYLKKQRKVI